MAITYTQTDTSSSNCNSTTELIACSGLTGGTTFCKVASVGGTPGVTEIAETITASASRHIDGFVTEITPASGVTWDAGTWTIRVNVTTANMNCTISDIFICRVNSSCVNQETIGSATGLSISMGTTGVKTQTVSGSAVTPSANDKVLISIAVSNSAMSNQTLGWTPSENIDSPFTAVTSPQPNVNDSVTVTESVNMMLNPMLFNVFDSVTLTEATQRNMLLFPQPFDSVTVTESITTNLVNNIGVFDSVTVTEDARVHVLVMPVVFDSVTVAEQVTTLLTSLNIEANDSVTLTESVAITFQEGAAGISVDVFDSVTVADDTVRVHILVMPTVSDSVTVTEQTQFNMLVMPSVFDTVTTTESVTVAVVSVSALQISAFDTITVADELTVVMVGDAPQPDVGQTPAGRSRRRERFIARYKGQEYSFDSPEQLEAFVESIRTPAQKRRGKKPAVKIVVPQRIEQELARFDLPSIQAELARFDWRSAIRTWNRYEALRQSQGLDLSEAQRHQDYILARQIELEDEELMLL